MSKAVQSSSDIENAFLTKGGKHIVEALRPVPPIREMQCNPFAAGSNQSGTIWKTILRSFDGQIGSRKVWKSLSEEQHFIRGKGKPTETIIKGVGKC